MNILRISLRFIGLIILIKFIYIILGYWILGYPENFSFETILELFNRNDSGWYRSIVENGYPKISSIEELGGVNNNKYNQSSWAFFPLYPALLKCLCLFFNLSFNQAAFILSIVLPFLLVLSIFKYIERVTENLSLASFTVFLILAFPYSLFLHVYYSESLYFLLVILSFYTIHANKKIYFSIFLALLVLVRPNAILTLIAIFFYYFEINKLSFKQIKNYRVLFLFIPSIISFTSYLIYQKMQTSYFFAFSMAQKGWNKTLTFPLLSLFNNGDLALQVGSVVSVMSIILLLFYTRRGAISMTLFSWTNLFLPLSAGTSMSMGRYVLPIFPLFFYAGEILYKWKYRYILIVILTILQCVLYQYWLQSHRLSY